MSQQLEVNSEGGDYLIHINAGNWQDFVSTVLRETRPSTVIVAADANVGPLYGDAVSKLFREADAKVVDLRCQAGETAKSVAVLQDWWEKLASAKVDRKSVVVAVGGGVVGDLAGFLAASHLRGLSMVQVPTSLLAQVDSSVGGKVGINLPQGKNLVGAFWQPKLVWIDTEVLSTLSDREFSAGLAEVVKYAVIADGPFFDWLNKHRQKIWDRDRDTIAHVIRHCCQIKAQVVADDTRETTGRRAILNFGHTVGHAIENLSGYGVVLHGEAVAMGMVAEGKLAVQMELCDQKLLEDLTELLKQFHLPTEMPKLDFEELKVAMQGDKKNTDSKIVFVLPTQMGEVVMRDDAPITETVFK